jgi:hypothetical protein
MLLCACPLITASQSTSPFVGAWKLNPAKSTLTDEMEVKSVGGNKYTFELGGGPETIVVDGTDQQTPVYKDGTLAVGAEGDTWKVIRKRGGRAIITATWSLSKNDSLLSDHFTSFNADGSPYTVNYVYKRTAPGTRFVGTWLSTSVEAVNYIILIHLQSYEEGGLAIVDEPSAFTGNMQFGASAVSRVDEHTVELMRKKADGGLAPFLQLKLSPDLKTMTITPYSATGNPRHVFVFDRQ